MSNDYERAVGAARRIPITVPEFEVVAKASDVQRERWAEDDRDHRARARRWFSFTAALWLAFPLFRAFMPDPFLPDVTLQQLLFECMWIIPMVPALVWAAHLSGDRRLRANIITRGIAVSTLILMLMFSFSEFNGGAVFSILIIVAMGRALQLLGERGLDGSGDQNSDFEPVRFRGVLILTLILACADAVTLLWSGAVGVVSEAAAYLYLVDFEPSLLSGWSIIGTAVMTALMPINVWGLLRLRTWALFSGMLANIAVGILALTEVLVVGSFTAIALTTTAVVQLLLVLPILVAALGLEREGTRQYAWVVPGLLWGVVPATVLITVVVATTHLMWSLQWNIIPRLW